MCSGNAEITATREYYKLYANSYFVSDGQTRQNLELHNQFVTEIYVSLSRVVA
jgi:hypothetical protein